MNQNDADAQVMPEKTEDDVRLVPVSESIRYRKRAQQAEQRIEELTRQLNQTKGRAENLEKHLSEIEVEQQLTRKLVSADVNDIETALLVAKDRAHGKEDLNEVIEQMKIEKSFLFKQKDICDTTNLSSRTTGAKDKNIGGTTALQQAAKRAASTGSHSDLQEYLKLRRNYI